MPIPAFGTEGIVDLKVGVMSHATGKPVQIDLEKGEVGLHATPTIVGDIAIVGSAFSEGLNYPRRSNSRGLVRAFDVRTGRRLWSSTRSPSRASSATTRGSRDR